MTVFIIKDWQNAPPGWKIGDPIPPGATPLDDSGMTNLEQRIQAAVADLDARITALAATTVVVTDPGETSPNPASFSEDDLWIEVLS